MSFRKQNPAAPAGFFAAEAAGLRWLAAAPGGASVVEVIEVGEAFIELEDVPSGRPTAAAAPAFGAALARIHDAGAAGWGVPPGAYRGPTFIGRQPMSCHPAATFGAFYAEQRVLPYLRAARTPATWTPPQPGSSSGPVTG